MAEYIHPLQKVTQADPFRWIEVEDVAGWAREIAQWMQQRENAKAISLTQLQQGLGMPMVEVWMGLLLSQEQHYQLEQRGGFYDLKGIWHRQRGI